MLHDFDRPDRVAQDDALTTASSATSPASPRGNRTFREHRRLAAWTTNTNKCRAQRWHNDGGVGRKANCRISSAPPLMSPPIRFASIAFKAAGEKTRRARIAVAKSRSESFDLTFDSRQHIDRSNRSARGSTPTRCASPSGARVASNRLGCASSTKGRSAPSPRRHRGFRCHTFRRQCPRCARSPLAGTPAPSTESDSPARSPP